MAFALPEHWVWDFWLARDGDDFHLFFLQAPKSIGDPDARHWNASIGHARSTDLVAWEPLGACFRPAQGPAWDDGTTWTGSIIRHAGEWWMFYTGTSRGESLRRQRIGLATSTDLHDWRRFDGNPVLDLDPCHYEEYDPALWHDRSLRDPWVAPDPTGSGFRMWFTARAKTGPADGRGVIGTAWSADLLSWRTEPPVTPSGDFGECEVPQYFSRGERHYLLFSTSARRTSSRRLEQLAKTGSPAETGTHYFVADRPSGPWRLGPMPFLAGEAVGTLYAGRVVEGRDRTLFFLGFQGDQRDGTFAGAISDPIPVEIGADGRLMLSRLSE
jgi:beta-fructofuranosidase